MLNGYGPADYGLTLLYTILVPFKLISKSNHKARYLAPKFRKFEQDLATLAKLKRIGPILEKGWVVILPHFKNKLHCDYGNLSKGILDGLVKGKSFVDDKYIATTTLPAVYGDQYSSIEVWG